MTRHERCYLCGEFLSEPISRDHVPPQRFFVREIRRKFNLAELITLPTHEDCNKSWRMDEEYFVHTFLPFARGSISGDALYRDGIARIQRGTNVPLANAVLKEFQQHVNGVILPANRVAKKFDPQRVHDVIYKIIRGLHYHHEGEILPAVTSCHFTVTPPGEEPPFFFVELEKAGLLQQEGRYRGVFAYARRKFSEANNLHFWAMLFWDKLLITAAFHDSECQCEECSFVGPPQLQSGDRRSH
jgi:hypothetical protein